MIYCREKLVDILLQSRHVALEELFDFDIALAGCLRRGVFTKAEWLLTEHFLATGEGFNDTVERVIFILAVELGYTDDRFLNNRPSEVKTGYYRLEKETRL